ncbi:hypothetical protein ACH41H_48630 [Streptomyces sp. NPDC020800]|uniref:hypothetical protein n=1 Tax=Streptomyces sp. NPDC020800 TaxID=3365092 RepID=UPI0037A84A31
MTGLGHNNVGNHVCIDGANGGVHCNVEIAKTNISVPGTAAICVPPISYATKYTTAVW